MLRKCQKYSKDVRKLKSHYHDVDAEKLVRGIKEASTAILDPVRKIVKEREKKEREEAFDAIFREGKRNHKEGHDAAGTHGGGEGDFRGDFSENGGQHDPVQPFRSLVTW